MTPEEEAALERETRYKRHAEHSRLAREQGRW